MRRLAIVALVLVSLPRLARSDDRPPDHYHDLAFGASSHHLVVGGRSIQTETFDIDLGLDVGSLYVAAETQLGSSVGGGGIAGVSLPDHGSLSSRIELFVGGATVSVKPNPVRVPTWIVEPRFRLEERIRPWFRVEAWAGCGVAAFGDWSLGIAASVHVGHRFDDPAI